MRVHLIGTGAIGSLYGALLARSGFSVTAQCRSDFDIVKAGGIRIESLVGLGDWVFKPEQVIQEGHSLDIPPDIVILAVKLTAECDRIALLKPIIGPKTTV